jgi:putative sigma-54 modulation protein
MRIEIRGRNVEVTEEHRDHVRKRFARIGRQVSDLATLDIELTEERNPSIQDSQIAEARLHLKGITLTARERSPQMVASIKSLAEDMRRQVKRDRELRRKRSTARRFKARLRGQSA